MKINFLDLKRQYKTIKTEIDESVNRVIKKQFFILGEELTAFEKEFAKYLGIKYVIGVNSGTDALILGLRSLGIKEGDQVITPANSFIATTLAITELGATPVFVDVNPKTHQIDEDQVIKKINKKTKAILTVHLYGLSSNIEKLKQIAKTNNIYLVEDVAQGVGAKFSNKNLGTFSDISTFSFYPGKNLGAYGDAGAIATDNKTVYEKLLMLRNYGQKKKYHHQTIGINSRLDEIQAAVLRTKLKYLDGWNKRRNEIAKLYADGLDRKHVELISFPEKVLANHHLFIINVEQRDQLQKYLMNQGIQTLIHYPIPIHLQECYQYLAYKKGDFPHAEKLAKRILSLPMYPELKNTEITYIINQVNSFFK